MTQAAQLPFSPASERNKQPIFEALRPRLPETGRLIEIGAGTGQHAEFMAPQLPGIQWLATDREPELPGLGARLAAAGLAPPRGLEVVAGTWPAGPFDAAYSANTTHIMHWPQVCAMFAGVGRCLRPGGSFFLYGPFNRGGEYTAPGNAAFDRQLRSRDPAMGLRDLGDIESLARGHHLLLVECLAMPANNLLLVFRRDAGEIVE